MDLLVGGFPCVSLSMLTTTPGSVLDQDCESGRGYLGMEGAIKTTKPKAILIENVASLFSKRAAEKDAEPALLGSRKFRAMGLVFPNGQVQSGATN